MTRVLHILAGMDVGGVETWLVHVLRALQQREVKLEMLVHTPRKCFYDDEVRALGGSLIHITSPRSFVRYGAFLFMVLRRKQKFDAVHCHLHYFSGWVVLIAWLARIPVRLVHSHNDLRAEEQSASFLRRAYVRGMRFLVRRFATAGIACSGCAADDLFGSKWRNDYRFKVCLCGLNFDQFSGLYTCPQQIADLRASLGIPHNAFVVGHVGRFTEQKNHEFLLRIFREYRKTQPLAHLVLIGDGHLKPAIKDLVREADLGDWVHFLGNQRKLAKYLAIMDAFVFPSKWEGLGLVVVEAQAAGVPVLASTAVPTEAVVCKELVRRLPLSQSAEEWSLELGNLGNHFPRSKSYSEVSESRFSISNNIKDFLQAWGVEEHSDSIAGWHASGNLGA